MNIKISNLIDFITLTQHHEKNNDSTFLVSAFCSSQVQMRSNGGCLSVTTFSDSSAICHHTIMFYTILLQQKHILYVEYIH